MCGIVLGINIDLNEKKINESLLHRGPDEQAKYTFGNVQMYHLRLSIVDIHQGKQPMHYLNRYSIIFNGEIYNHHDLRIKYKLNCVTNSDTETILQLYHLQKHNFLSELDGMFAMAILDKEENKIFIARDRAGKKPIYIYRKNNTLLLSSELNCIRSTCNELTIAHENIFRYLRFGSMFREDTPYNEVSEFENGKYVYLDVDTLKTEEHKWFDISDYYLKTNRLSLNENTDRVDQILHASIKRRLLSSDLEVGAFLSGGIDSGLITSIASQYSKQLKTFTVKFDGDYNEAPLAKLVAQKFNTIHSEINISFANIQNDIEKIILSYGEPFFDSSAIPSYYVSREAKKHVTVILNGDGADELFGGYKRYVPFHYFDFFNTNKIISSFSNILYSSLPKSHEKKSLYNYFVRSLKIATKKKSAVYLTSTVDIFEDYENKILSNDHEYLYKSNNLIALINSKNKDGINKLLNLDFEVQLFTDLLVKMDIATMQHSVEARSPFLCKEMLEFAPTIHEKFKIKGSNTKYLLRKLSENYLPSEISKQPKRGFEIPLKDWVNNDLKELIFDSIMKKNNITQQYVNFKWVLDILDKKIKIPEEQRAKILWTLFCLEIWHKNN